MLRLIQGLKGLFWEEENNSAAPNIWISMGLKRNASTQRLATSEKERQLEDDFLNQGVHVHVENDDDIDVVSNTRWREKIGTSGERRCKEPKISKSDKLKK
ncbi:Uncharacterized protein Fot_28566 [Forsythia ovata]|uniref:Uncharacterized protein n=1 Tax=Forsythia ovata TaxID=205694 RepID=A0ABD1TQ72_9LAMI